jgi:proteic killer suppression protein
MSAKVKSGLSWWKAARPLPRVQILVAGRTGNLARGSHRTRRLALLRIAYYVLSMILGFSDRATERLWHGGHVRAFASFAKAALIKLDLLAAAASLDDLRTPPGNRLEALKGGRKGQHSIRINQQWRICFVWTPNGPDRVEIVDYH